MITIRLAKEYLASPIFCPDVDTMGHVEVEDLPISKSLIKAINDWNAEYQSTYNDDYPPDSGFNTLEEDADHVSRGAVLAERLRAELGDSYFVQYEP